MKKKGLMLALVLLLGTLCLFAGGRSDKNEAASADFSMNETGLPILNEPMTFEIAAATQKNKNFKELEFFKNLDRSRHDLIVAGRSHNDCNFHKLQNFTSVRRINPAKIENLAHIRMDFE